LNRQLPPLVVRLLLNMYTKHAIHVPRNGVSSKPFMVSNAVKEGAVISQILFCIFIDGFCKMLVMDAIIIGNVFLGALAYSDDIAIIAPTPVAMILQSLLLLPLQ